MIQWLCRKLVRLILILSAFLFIPAISLALWMSPYAVLRSLIDHIKSGEPFGPFDGGHIDTP